METILQVINTDKYIFYFTICVNWE